MKWRHIMAFALFLPVLCSAEYYSSDYDARMRELQADLERQELESQKEREHECFVKNENWACKSLTIVPLCQSIFLHRGFEDKQTKKCEIAKKAIYHGCEELYQHDICHRGMDFYADRSVDDYTDEYDILYSRDADPKLVLHYANLACQYKSKNNERPRMDYCRFAERLKYIMTRR